MASVILTAKSDVSWLVPGKDRSMDRGFRSWTSFDSLSVSSKSNPFCAICVSLNSERMWFVRKGRSPSIDGMISNQKSDSAMHRKRDMHREGG